MRSQIFRPFLPALRRATAVAAVLGVQLAWDRTACAVLESGVYQTTSDATVEERGDRVPNGSRIVPFSAALTIDLGANQPSLTAVIPNAVLEGGDPFALTVHSSLGTKLVDGTFQFTGDYLRDNVPSGTQYLFDWEFSTSSDGRVLWNGVTGWAGGHLWQVTISDIAIQAVPEPNVPTLVGGSIGILWAYRSKGAIACNVGRFWTIACKFLLRKKCRPLPWSFS